MSEELPRKEDLQKGKRSPINTQAVQANGEDNESLNSVPMYKNIKLVIPLFVIILALAILAWYWYIGMRDYVSTDDAYIDGNRVSISAKLTGRIDKLLVDEGDTVRQNQVLVYIDDSDLRAQEAQSKAALTLAQANISLARVNLDKAQTDLRRAQEQFKENIIPREQLDHAQSEFESAQARHTISLAQVAAARAQLGVIETQLKNTVIESPMDGIISKRWALAGDVIQPGQAIFSVYDLKNIWVTANLEETNIAALKPNDRVEILVDAYPDQNFYGTVFQVGSSTAAQFSLIPPNNASGNFTKITQRVPVKISIQPASPSGQPSPQLLPGMSVEVKIKVH